MADMEAPGLATLFFDEELIGRGVLDYLIEHEIDVSVPVTDYVLDVTEPALLDENEGQLFLVPAGKVDKNYLQKLARIERVNAYKTILTGESYKKIADRIKNWFGED